MMRTLVAALTACLVCLTLAGCKCSSGGGGTEEKREVSSETRPAPGGGTTMIREKAEGSDESPDE